MQCAMNGVVCRCIATLSSASIKWTPHFKDIRYFCIWITRSPMQCICLVAQSHRSHLNAKAAPFRGILLNDNPFFVWKNILRIKNCKIKQHRILFIIPCFHYRRHKTSRRLQVFLITFLANKLKISASVVIKQTKRNNTSQYIWNICNLTIARNKLRFSLTSLKCFWKLRNYIFKNEITRTYFKWRH